MTMQHRALADWRLQQARPRHLYIHIPFCHRRCAYCDFNTYANMEDRMGAYVDALCAELAMLAEMPPAPPPAPATGPGLTLSDLKPTIFLGGGTPTMLPIELMERVLRAADAVVPLAGAEVTSEANPGTVLGRSYLADLRSMGVNRVSMGVQSIHDPTLRVLGRIHTAAEARESFEDARRAGFEQINLDFIFGLPGQTQGQWESTLDTIATWGADHFSLYSLILEESTPLYAQVTSGRISVPDDDEAGAMYELAMERLAAAGYQQYEISNWALPRAGSPPIDPGGAPPRLLAQRRLPGMRGGRARPPLPAPLCGHAGDRRLHPAGAARRGGERGHRALRARPSGGDDVHGAADGVRRQRRALPRALRGGDGGDLWGGARAA
jgi:oxygen-independent coproporphyrinogen III oxidase